MLMQFCARGAKLSLNNGTTNGQGEPIGSNFWVDTTL